ncbi:MULTISPECIES: SDR family NAD(P)-dependent oxidoreductase [unclassified Bradyrhizobium]|uniref:SDR family NAD(P)-dependent oxidoreductase n=1 Tax=unclassified Bradyrhizobium TaxID=2631580 RepID=UPI003D244B3B
MRLPRRRSPVCTTLGQRNTFLLATASRGIGHATGKLLSEEGRRIFTCTRHPFGGGRCRRDLETDNHVQVDLGIRRTVPRATAKVAERLVGAPLHLLSHNAGISP